MIGSCDCCDRENVPVSFSAAHENNSGSDTTACFICQGGDDPDPFCELDGARSSTATERWLKAMRDAMELILLECDEAPTDNNAWVVAIQIIARAALADGASELSSTERENRE